MPSLAERIKGAWDAFVNAASVQFNTGPGFTYKPDRHRLSPTNERTIVSSIINRIGIDVAAISIRHVQLDENERYDSDIKSPLNECFTVEANLDQTGRAFIQDVVMSMCDEGCIAVVPTVTSGSPLSNDKYKIYELRVGKILEWYPEKVKVELYNPHTAKTKELIFPKRSVAIIENPLYSVMNEPNSTLMRLKKKLALLDFVDEQSGSGKLDMIIQLPYIIKTEARKQQAEERRKMIENQLKDSKYGIAYTDGTEKITQLNRSLDNNLLKQIESLTTELYGELGLTANVFNGTADEKEMLNYHNRTIEPIISAIVDEFKRKFLTNKDRKKGQTIMFFKDPFKLVPVGQIADIADRFTRNEIMTSNEFRQVIGMKPSDDPNADVLRNKNISSPAEAQEADAQAAEEKALLEQQEAENYQ